MVTIQTVKSESIVMPSVEELDALVRLPTEFVNTRLVCCTPVEHVELVYVAVAWACLGGINRIPSMPRPN